MDLQLINTGARRRADSEILSSEVFKFIGDEAFFFVSIAALCNTLSKHLDFDTEFVRKLDLGSIRSSHLIHHFDNNPTNKIDDVPIEHGVLPYVLPYVVYLKFGTKGLGTEYNGLCFY